MVKKVKRSLPKEFPPQPSYHSLFCLDTELLGDYYCKGVEQLPRGIANGMCHNKVTPLNLTFSERNGTRELKADMIFFLPILGED